MNFEQLLYTSVTSQLQASTGWLQIEQWQSFDKVLSNFSFQYLLQDMVGTKANLLLSTTQVNVYHGIIRVGFPNNTNALLELSTATSLIYIFTNGGGYVPPAPAPGDFTTINSLQFASADPPQYDSKNKLRPRDYYVDCYFTFT